MKENEYNKYLDLLNLFGFVMSFSFYKNFCFLKQLVFVSIYDNVVFNVSRVFKINNNIKQI